MSSSPYTVYLPAGPPGVSWSLPQGVRDTAALPCVVLADRAGFSEFAVLQRALRVVGVPSVRIDAGSAGESRVSGRVPGDVIDVDGRSIVPTVVWVRHFTPAAIPVGGESWCAWIGQLPAVHLPGGAPGRLTQLAGAARRGVRVPRTIVTTDPPGAARKLGCERVMVKALGEHFAEVSPGVLEAAFPRIAAPGDLAPADRPVMVQEYVEHQEELRVYHLGGELRAFLVGKPAPEAIWRDEASVTVRLARVPPDVATAARVLAADWGLRYAALDFLLTRAGPVFLEANADGDWRWFEARAGCESVSLAAASMLRDLHDRSSALDLTGFLALRTFRGGE
ncbi:RimK family alpha-L-glutamate ligase [Nonomuraea sp. NPDC050663]|uniref:RimK family alpha-L-glutamate ligase n=1 Tax=Nonomuraea sp. NPDC050663 TaxID=3364370 RepID=UPI0037A16918